MARKQTTTNQQQLERTLSHLAAIIQDLAPQAQVDISLEPYEDADATLYIHLPATTTTEDIERLELTVGKHCNEILLDTDLFIISAVSA